MKNLLIVFLLSAFVISIESCTPKVVITSTTRSSEKYYKKAIRKEIRARKMHIKKELNDYIYEQKQRQKNADPDSVRKITDSLLDSRCFKFTATTGISGTKNIGDYSGHGGQYSGSAYFRNNTLILYLDRPFTGWCFISKYKEIVRTNKKREFEIRLGYGQMLFYLDVFPNGKADLYCKYLRYNHTWPESRGLYSGRIEPIEEPLNLF